MNTERLKEIESFKLDTGKHKSLKEGACIMEIVSYINNEPWSDHPQCACPILTEYAIRLNDKFNDAHRQLLKPFIPLLVGTRLNNETQIARKQLLMWRNVTAVYPLILELYKLPELANQLRTLGNTVKDMAEAEKLLIDNKEIIYKNAYADAYANAYDYANPYAYAYADAYANANAYAHADANAYAYAYAHAYADSYAYAYANANANAYAHADANAYAYAYALRNKLVSVAIDTLKMTIEVNRAGIKGE